MADDVTDTEESDEDTGDYVTGPFCRHWHDPSDCDEPCVCGHECHEHDNYSGDSACEVDGCTCEGWTEKPDDTPVPFPSDTFRVEHVGPGTPPGFTFLANARGVIDGRRYDEIIPLAHVIAGDVGAPVFRVGFSADFSLAVYTGPVSFNEAGVQHFFPDLRRQAMAETGGRPYVHVNPVEIAQ